MVGTTKLPVEHASATLGRLDKVQDTLSNGKVQDPTADKLYMRTSLFSIVSPGYTVQRTSYIPHPAQEFICETDLTRDKVVTFLQITYSCISWAFYFYMLSEEHDTMLSVVAMRCLGYVILLAYHA